MLEAQQPKKLHRSRYSIPVDPPTSNAFREGLREFGYVEGKNMIIEYRYTEGNTISYHEFLAELVRLKVDVIIADGVDCAAAAKNTTNTIPIVMTCQY